MADNPLCVAEGLLAGDRPQRAGTWQLARGYELCAHWLADSEDLSASRHERKKVEMITRCQGKPFL